MGFQPLTPLGSRGIFVPGSSVYQASLRACGFETSSAFRQGGSAGVGGAAISGPGPAGDALAHAVLRFAGDPTARAALAPGGCQHPGTLPQGLTSCQVKTPGKSRLLFLPFSKGHVATAGTGVTCRCLWSLAIIALTVLQLRGDVFLPYHAAGRRFLGLCSARVGCLQKRAGIDSIYRKI